MKIQKITSAQICVTRLIFFVFSLTFADRFLIVKYFCSGFSFGTSATRLGTFTNIPQTPFTVYWSGLIMIVKTSMVKSKRTYTIHIDYTKANTKLTYAIIACLLAKVSYELPLQQFGYLIVASSVHCLCISFPA